MPKEKYTPKVSTHVDKKRLLDQLASELQALDENVTVKRETQFRDAILGLMEQHDFSLAETAQILKLLDGKSQD
ncbi:hypothetical protein [Mangrovitalea sediminis]|uniref:hypothetical protein n=1 Tax=Mangrovitalea sediminis TaxID=1982043 RepID=UPI000BE51078|nr:hypothetical protein [Mangrovitalea sediminis]